ncbi:MAG: adenylate kinase [Victivallaceae bacterium]|nr:adenylate kinase [Victivallaceae bacterium]
MVTKKNLIFLGAPGAGKGTASSALTEREPLAHISTGDILRAEIKNGTELGKSAAVLMEKGGLVPDDLVAGMVKSRLRQPDCDNGFILDGFPRTVNQANLLDQALKEIGRKIDAVIYFEVDDEILLQRLTARISCGKCGRIYNKLFLPPKQENICDDCNTALFQRPDDSRETAEERLKVFYKNTQPLIDYYRERKLLTSITEIERDKMLAALFRELT